MTRSSRNHQYWQESRTQRRLRIQRKREIIEDACLEKPETDLRDYKTETTRKYSCHGEQR